MPRSTTSSRGSTGAKGTSYKVLAKTSQVDEALFGHGSLPRESQMQMLPPEPPVPAAIVTKKKSLEDAVILSSKDLDRIKSTARILTREEEHEMKRRIELEKTQMMQASKERKERMLKLEEEAKRSAPPTETEKLQVEQQGNLLDKAKRMLDEDLDEVKRMNQMVLYSKCVTIRDAQLEEKKQVLTEKEIEDARLDRVMEMERLKALRMYEDREAERAEKQKRGAEVLRQQMSERERERIHQLELQEQERQQILANIELLKKEEKEKLLAQKEEGRRLLEEVAAANAEQIRRKQILAVQEKEEEKRIAAYLAQKDRDELARMEEEERKRAERERETARLRAMQEKAIDTKAQEDALRAKRASEEKERDWRRKEKEERERDILMQQQLALARDAQKFEKEKRLAEEARSQREEFERILNVQSAERAEEARKEHEDLNRRLKLKEELRQQIAQREEQARRERQEFLEEGNKLRAERSLQQSKLETIKTQKLYEMESMGVPGKYRAELERKKIYL